ncbi:hypothetical protein [Synechococcus sp. GEYO]|uniref:hypothetical protein n=1 Tax=Synechococcus sp. GEYO TaxID=2575511 RepID=UPI00352FA15B
MSKPIFPPGFPAGAVSTPGHPSPAAAGISDGKDEAPSLEQIVRIAHDKGDSDVHLGVGERPRYRARGEMLTTKWPCSTQHTFQHWLKEILTPQQIDDFHQIKEFDGGGMRFLSCACASTFWTLCVGQRWFYGSFPRQS